MKPPYKIRRNIGLYINFYSLDIRKYWFNLIPYWDNFAWDYDTSIGEILTDDQVYRIYLTQRGGKKEIKYYIKYLMSLCQVI